MKKTAMGLMTALMITAPAMADYEIFKSQTRSIHPVKTEVVYFGPYNDFASKLKSGGENGALAVAVLGTTAGAVVGGIGGLIYFLDPFMMSWRMDQKYLKVIKMTDSRGNVAFKKILFVGDKNPSYDEKFMNEVMK